MHVELRRVEGHERVSRWLLVAYSVWASMVLIVHLINTFTDADVLLCLFRRFTHHPCPSCGSTRAVSAFLSGSFGEAFWLNPLVMTVLVAGGLLVLLRVIAGRHLRVVLRQRERHAAWLLLAAAVGFNWWHVARYHADAGLASDQPTHRPSEAVPHGSQERIP